MRPLRNLQSGDWTNVSYEPRFIRIRLPLVKSKADMEYDFWQHAMKFWSKRGFGYEPTFVERELREKYRRRFVAAKKRMLAEHDKFWAEITQMVQR